MKAISLTQPWASLVAFGAKMIETRSWGTNYRGPLAIHAAKGLSGFNEEDFNQICEDPEFFAALIAGLDADNAPLGHFLDVLPRGAVIATCTLTRVEMMIEGYVPEFPECKFGSYAVGRYAWHLSDIQKINPPVPAKGRLGLWEWNP